MSDAWDVASVAAVRGGVRIDPLVTLDDLDRVGPVIERTWGGQAFQREILRAFQHAGCVLLGAREQDTGDDAPLVGFVFGFLGHQGGLHLHSHMLAVLEPWQAKGVGFALKVAQRAAAMDVGVHEMRWTFDPMILRNAWFNLGKLGTLATRLLRDFYGDMTDQVNRGERSDRFEVTWSLQSERVRAAAEGRPHGAADDGVVLLTADGDPAAPRPLLGETTPGPRSLVAVPRDHVALRRADRGLAAAWREAAAAAFQACFDAGLVATGVTPRGFYVFEREAR
jgi:predicted GNAT superfamily acetyltransferase